MGTIQNKTRRIFLNVRTRTTRLVAWGHAGVSSLYMLCMLDHIEKCLPHYRLAVHQTCAYIQKSSSPHNDLTRHESRVTPVKQVHKCGRRSSGS